MPMSRRAFLKLTGAVALATGLPPEGVAKALLAQGEPVRAAAELTTLTQRLVRGEELRSGSQRTYHAVGTGPGEPHVVRDDLVAAQPGREGRRRSLVCFAHLTDQHIVDGQSPARVEFLDRYSAEECGDRASLSSAWRAHEAASARIADAMLQRLRRIQVSPVTGAPIAATICTGDNHDNQQRNELGIFLDVMNGGTVAPQSGDGARYEGVQSSGEYDYWHPDPDVPDAFKEVFGFPARAGWLEEALAPFAAAGAGMPWYSCYGNHDGLAQGNMQPNAGFESIGTGPAKFVGPPPGNPCAGLADLGQPPAAPAMAVTADPERAYIGRQDWIRQHVGAGGDPAGHGFDQGNVDRNEAYYVRDVGELRWIVLDTVNPLGYASGNVGAAQLAWLEARLAEAQEARKLVLLFSHHGLRSLDNPVLVAPDPLPEPRARADEVLAVVSRFPAVIGWVNGHTHKNTVGTQEGPFWDIGTAAHIDWPGQARIVEVVDNRDGTLSIFTTLIDYEDDPVAAFGRELTGNDPRKGFGYGEGAGPEDRNTELLIVHPFAEEGGRPEPMATPAADPIAQPAAAPVVTPTRTPLPATGPAVPLTIGGALAVAAGAGVRALELRGRRIAAAASRDD